MKGFKLFGVAEYLEEVDQAGVQVVVNLYFAGWFSQEKRGSTPEDFYINVVGRQ